MIKHGNDRSLRALRRAFDRIGWEDGRDHWITDGPTATSVWVRSTSTA